MRGALARMAEIKESKSMVRSIRKAISGLVKKLTIGGVKSCFSYDETPAESQEIATSLKLELALIEQCLSNADSFPANQSDYDCTRSESALAEGSQAPMPVLV